MKKVTQRYEEKKSISTLFFTMYTTNFRWFIFILSTWDYHIFFIFIKFYVNGKTWKFLIHIGTKIYCVNTQSSSRAACVSINASQFTSQNHNHPIESVSDKQHAPEWFPGEGKFLSLMYVHSVRIVGCARVYTTMSSKWESERKKENFHPHITREKLHFAATRSSRSLDTRYKFVRKI